jgi:thioredoxin reductase (NADPH)
MSTIDTRREQMFPKLEPREIDRLRRFGKVRRYAAGEALFVTGEIAPGMFVLIKGSARLTRRDPLGHSAPILEQGPGEFVAEVGNCPASQRSSTSTRSKTWKRFSSHPKICAP